MNILIIIGNYYPYSSSVANCMKPLITSLVDSGHKVHLITNNTKTKKNFYETVDGVSLYGLVDSYSNIVEKINNSYKDKINETKFKTLFLKLLKLPFLVRYNLLGKARRRGGWTTKESVILCSKLFETYKLDLMISVSLPFTSHAIAYQFKKYYQKDIRWIVFEFDPYTYNVNTSRFKFIRQHFKKRELAVFSLADKIILTPELLEFYKYKEFGVYEYKMEQLNYIIGSHQDYNKNTVPKDILGIDKKHLFVYAGGFYADIRCPLFALELFECLVDDFVFVIFTDYKEQKFQNIINRSSGIFKLMGNVVHEEVVSWFSKANFLVSIGNTIEVQVPAKIFEYMSLGKPIIHFSKILNDPAIKYLSLYPAAFIIKEFEGKNDIIIKQLKTFIENFNDITISSDKIEECLKPFNEKVVIKNFLSIVDGH